MAAIFKEVLMGHRLFWIFIIAWVAMDLYLILFHSQKNRKAETEKRTKYIMILLILIGMFGGQYIAPDSQLAFDEPFQSWRYLSILFIALGVFIRVTAIYQLGSSFSVNLGAAEEGLYQKGLYSKVRHPSYLGEIVAFLGVAIAFNHPVSSAMAFLFPLIAFSYRIHKEEIILLEEMKDDYQEYIAKTKRLIPFVY